MVLPLIVDMYVKTAVARCKQEYTKFDHDFGRNHN